jgi:hypothetical protein
LSNPFGMPYEHHMCLPFAGKSKNATYGFQQMKLVSSR